MVSCLGTGVGTQAGSESPMPQRERQRQLQTRSLPDCCSPDPPGCPGNEQSAAEPGGGGWGRGLLRGGHILFRYLNF